jgi:polyferredoxin
MRNDLPYQLFADAVLTLHVAIVAFVVGGLVLIILGNLRKWRWVNALWFRLTHLGAIAVVVAEVWLGITCPLTTLEMWLRAKAHTATYSGSFVEYWLQRLLYYEVPAWAFMVGYSLFGVFVVATWFYFPPTRHDREGTNT